MKPKIVFLSGLAGTAAAWQPLTALLEAVKPVVPEVPWSIGTQQWPSDGESVADFLADACEGADVVVAHSFAATLLLEYLSASGSTGTPVPGAAVLLSVFYRPRKQDFRWAHISHFLDDFDRILALGIQASSRTRLAPERVGDMARIVREQIGPYGWMAFYESYLRTPRLNVGAMPCRVVLVHGADDTAAPLDDCLALSESLQPEGLHVLEDTGHFPMRDAPDEIFNVILSLQSKPVAPDRGGTQAEREEIFQ